MSNSPANLKKVTLAGELLMLGPRLGSVSKDKRPLLLMFNERGLGSNDLSVIF